MKTHDIGGSVKVTIPKNFAVLMGITPGCKVMWEFDIAENGDRVIFIYQRNVQCPEPEATSGADTVEPVASSPSAQSVNES